MPPGPPRRQKRDPEWIAPAAIPIESQAGDPTPRDLAYDFDAFKRAEKGEGVLSTVVVDGEPRRVFSAPVRSQANVVAVVQVSSSMEPALSALENLRTTLFTLVFPIGLVFGCIASLFVVDRLLQPLRRVRSEAERIGNEGFGEKLELTGNDEFAALAGTLNGMLGRLERIYHLEKEANRSLEQTVELQRRFTSDASHELKTPLSVITAYVSILKRSGGRLEDEVDTLEALDSAASRMSGLVQDLLVLARTDSGVVGRKRPRSLVEVVQEAIWSTPLGSEKVLLRDAISGVMVSVSDDELVRVFVNLFENAIKHSGSISPVEVAMTVDRDWALVSITDRGQGIAAEHIPHLFERFYRTDQSRRKDEGGSGLGLAICERIVAEHGGHISVTSKLGEGACFTVSLPLLLPA